MARNIGYAVVDLETTGLDKDGTDAIVEIAIVLLDSKGYVTGYYETIVKPNRPLAAVNIHKINEAMIVNAPSFGEIVQTVASLLKGRKLIAHNAEFEANFLRKEMFPHDVFINESNFIDTLKIARKVIKLRSYKLVSLTEYFQIPFFNAHTALSDTIALSEVWKRLKKFNRTETRKHVKAAKVFKYNGKTSYETSNWLPRNPDAFIQTYRPYQKFNLFKMMGDFKKVREGLRGLGYLLIGSLLAYLLSGDIQSPAMISGLLFWIVFMYLEHRWIQRASKRRNRSNKHQHGVSTVEESGGSVTFTVDDMVPVEDLEAELGKKFVEPDGEMDAVDEDEFDAWLKDAEIPTSVGSDLKVQLDGDEDKDFDAWVEDSFDTEVAEPNMTVVVAVEEDFVSPSPLPEAEIPIPTNVEPQAFNTQVDFKQQPELNELLNPVTLTEVQYRSQFKSLKFENEKSDGYIYDSAMGMYAISDNELDYMFKIVEYFVKQEDIHTGALFDVARITEGSVSRVKKNQLRGVFDVDSEFSYKDNASYVLFYDYGVLIVFNDSSSSWFSYRDLGFIFGYKSGESYNKIIVVKKDSSDGIQFEGRMVPSMLKAFKKLKLKFKNVI